jgi:integrase
LQLPALTFLRPGEARLGEWPEIDLAEKLWRIPAKRMKMRLDHLVPLSTQRYLQPRLVFTGAAAYDAGIGRLSG